MMMLKALYRMGLTDLTRDEVDQYENAVRSGARIEESRRVRLWGSVSLLLCTLLVLSALGTVSMLRTLYTISDLQAKVSNLDQAAAFKPEFVTRGGGDPDSPATTLKLVRKRTQEIHKELDALRLQSIDYSSLTAQRRRLAALNGELRLLSAKAIQAKRMLGAES
jgi:hypothetical protein